ncbi:MAG: bis-aminopropyl spermidine synthase family protein [Streptosporangiales bacterium]|nr:bis-aminopropyl spermidine synthase family protein [Streptosporangiales bacterium]
MSLLGLAPAGRAAILQALGEGKSSVTDLVAASALPRRDVEDFLASLPADHGKVLREYRESRPVLPPDLEETAASLISGAPSPLKRLDHVQATAETLVRRVRWLTDMFDLRGRSVLFAGDHDVTSLLLARVVPDDVSLTVADIDERLLDYVQSAGQGRVRGAWADFRFGLPPSLAQAADVIVTDPPYTPEGLGLFLSRSCEALRRDEPDARIVIAYGHSRRRPDLGVAAQREILSRDVAIDAMLPAFSRYDGAQAVGSASDWYSCQPSPKAFRRLGPAAQPGIYTRGSQSVESGASVADSIPDLGLSGRPAGLVSPAPSGEFAVTVGLGKLLADGVHPSVLGRAPEFVVDLRDDPGPWLLRSMLALNAERAVFVVPRRHEVPSADLLRAKYASIAPERAGDVTAIRCSLASGDTGDPVVDLARFVARRAHGRLRNVWREGLTRSGLTKREAAARVDEAAAAAGLGAADLSRRLIDLPAGRLPALSEALRA